MKPLHRLCSKFTPVRDRIAMMIRPCFKVPSSASRLGEVPEEGGAGVDAAVGLGIWRDA